MVFFLCNVKIESLANQFTMVELEVAVQDMKTNPAPGPNGLSVLLFKQFWTTIRGYVLETLNKLH